MAALKTYGQVGGPGLEKGEGRVWGHQDARDVGAERQIKKKVQMRGNGEGAKGTGRRPQGSADNFNVGDGGQMILPFEGCPVHRQPSRRG